MARTKTAAPAAKKTPVKKSAKKSTAPKRTSPAKQPVPVPELSDEMRIALRRHHFGPGFDDSVAYASKFHVSMTVPDLYTAVKEGTLAEIALGSDADEFDIERADRNAHFQALRAVVYLTSTHMMYSLVEEAPADIQAQLNASVRELLGQAS